MYPLLQETRRHGWVSTTGQAPSPSAATWLAFCLGLLSSPLVVLLLVAALFIGASPSGWGYLVGALVTCVGLLTRRWRRWRGLSRVGLGLLLLIACVRLLLAERQGLYTLRLPDEGKRLVNGLVDERDGTLLMAHALLLSGRLPSSDARGLVLLIAGRQDSMMPARLMRGLARRAGRLATLVEIDSGHFAFLDRHEACERAIASWLLGREREPRP